jgi:hypothetical protein
MCGSQLLYRTNISKHTGIKSDFVYDILEISTPPMQQTFFIYIYIYIYILRDWARMKRITMQRTCIELARNFPTISFLISDGLFLASKQKHLFALISDQKNVFTRHPPGPHFSSFNVDLCCKSEKWGPLQNPMGPKVAPKISHF